MDLHSAETQAVPPALDAAHVVVRPGHCGGKPHIAGHRVKVQHVAVWHERLGKSPDEIAAEHPELTLADVHAALSYYYDHREQIDADIRADEDFAAGLSAESPPSLLLRRLQSGHAPSNPLSPR
jgi:uncharacterized protein (DUF433 family)